MTSCIVTMFFDLRKYLGATAATRDVAFYMKHGVHTLSNPQHMVIFCDSSMRGHIENIRGDRPTTYVEKDIMDYHYVQTLFPMVIKNREKSSVYNTADQRNTPMHFLCTCFKFTAIFIAKQVYPADTYIWLDFGGGHILRNVNESIDAICRNPRPKIACCYIHYRSSNEVYPMKRYLQNGGPCSIAATSFTVASDYVERFYTKSMSVLYEQVTEGVGHNEEQVLVYIHNQHPEWFSLYFGDYYSAVTNYHKTIEDKHTVQHCFIHNAERHGQYELAQLARASME
jgi:hypothetical protein